MARITNFGRKRTYLEAGFGTADADEGPVKRKVESVPTSEGEQASIAKKKPRKRRRKGKTDVQAAATEGYEARGGQLTPNPARQEKKSRRAEERQMNAMASEHRRQKRIAERQAYTTCLACRKQGHAVKDCPEARIALHDDDKGVAGAPGKSVVGICYRCGSKKHNLSRCKKPADAADPLPFASCFVCLGQGHLASSCPRNEGKGIYPNGGSCKLCGQTSHLAKDCELKTHENASKSAVMLGSAVNEGGADEDDFHVLKRRRDAVQKEEQIVQKTADKPLPSVSKPKPKVVVFR